MDFPLVSFEVKQKYLLVVGHGKRDNFSSMVEASALIQQQIIETGCRYLLVDYRNLQINVSIAEAFNIVKRYEASVPELKNVVIAGVFERQNLTFANYWKEVGEKRGFFIRIFDSMPVAEQWLLKKNFRMIHT
ncbi:MAG: hypothetical protein ABL895_14240 [Cyclobacteriaceae bacterium]